MKDFIKVFVLTGDSNIGKTSTLNLFLTFLLGKPVELFTSNKHNASKCITCVKFIKRTDDSKYNISHNNYNENFKTFEDLQKKYNEVISNSSEYDYYNTVYICVPIEDDKLVGGGFIDVIGKTPDNILLYNNQIKHIDDQFPNNIKIHVTKSLSVEICQNHDNILVTHADKLNYDENKTDLTNHLMLLAKYPNNIRFVSNTDSRLSFNDDIKQIIYNKTNIVNYLISLGHKFSNNQSLDLTNLREIMINYNFNDSSDVLNKIIEFQDENLFNVAKYILKDIMSKSEINEKIKDFEVSNELMKKQYECYQKTGKGKNAHRFLDYEKYRLFGNQFVNEYPHVDNDEICNAFRDYHKEIYQNAINDLCNSTNNNSKKRRLF
jgi:hypothetical protein